MMPRSEEGREISRVGVARLGRVCGGRAVSAAPPCRPAPLPSEIHNMSFFHSQKSFHTVERYSGAAVAKRIRYQSI
jgi:hypothetical protein